MKLSIIVAIALFGFGLAHPSDNVIELVNRDICVGTHQSLPKRTSKERLLNRSDYDSVIFIAV